MRVMDFLEAAMEARASRPSSTQEASRFTELRKHESSPGD
jgi:hypothetical protein